MFRFCFLGILMSKFKNQNMKAVSCHRVITALASVMNLLAEVFQ